MSDSLAFGLMQNDELIRAHRILMGDHPIKRTPYNQIFAALSLALFIAVLVTAGWTWLLVTFVVWCAALMYLSVVSMRRALARLEQQREADRQAHETTLAGRRALAGTPGVTYEEQSAELAERFGRREQTVPRHTRPDHAHRAGHASGLVARGVLRSTLRRRPVTIFDLDVANEADLGLLSRRARFERAFALSGCYLTVCAVTLPFPLPHLSSLAAWDPGLTEALTGEALDEDERGVPPELRHTGDPEFAALMLSVPAVRKAAHNLDLPWTVSGDLLVTTVLTPSGLPVHSALRRADDLAELAEAFPWERLDAYRRDEVLTAPWPVHRSPLLTYESWLAGEVPDQSVLRWSHRPLGDTGAYAFQSRPTFLGDPR